MRLKAEENQWEPAPLASLFGYIQDRIEYLQVRQAHVSTLHRQAIFDACVLLFRVPADKHAKVEMIPFNH